jgi:hypothetical protein
MGRFDVNGGRLRFLAERACAGDARGPTPGVATAMRRREGA